MELRDKRNDAVAPQLADSCNDSGNLIVRGLLTRSQAAIADGPPVG